MFFLSHILHVVMLSPRDGQNSPALPPVWSAHWILCAGIVSALPSCCSVAFAPQGGSLWLSALSPPTFHISASAASSGGGGGGVVGAQC